MTLAWTWARWGGALAALALCGAADGEAAATDVPATYRMQGTAQVSASPAIDRSVDVRADTTLRARRPGEVAVTLAAEGFICEVVARAGAGGALRFDAGQRCPIDLRSSGARGHLDAVLRSGTGRVEGERLSLELWLDGDGAVSVHSASRVDVLGHEVEIPSTWLPETPVHGSAHVTASGARDRSQAAASASR